MSVMKRAVYRVRAAGRNGWRLVFPNRRTQLFVRKRAAVSCGRTVASSRWHDYEQPAQLVVHARDGRIQFEHTYGRDPERRRG